MPVVYDITVSNGGHDGTTDSRKRIDSAKLRAKRMAYDALAANALLDRQVAHDAMHKVDRWNGLGYVIVPCGPDRTLTITATQLP